MQAAAILVELAQVYEEKLSQPTDGFAMRIKRSSCRQTLCRSPELADLAGKYGQWKPLADLHIQRVERALSENDVPLDSLLAASQILEQKLGDPIQAFRLAKKRCRLPSVRRWRRQSRAACKRAFCLKWTGCCGRCTKKGGEQSSELALSRCRSRGSWPDCTVRSSTSWFDRRMRESKKQRCASTFCSGNRPKFASKCCLIQPVRWAIGCTHLPSVENAITAKIRRPTKYSSSPSRKYIVWRWSAARSKSGRRRHASAERAQTDLRRQQVACESAGWLDDFGNDPQRALKACIKALPMCQGRQRRAGRNSRSSAPARAEDGSLAWDEVARAERALAQNDPKNCGSDCCTWRRCGGKERRTRCAPSTRRAKRCG